MHLDCKRAWKRLFASSSPWIDFSNETGNVDKDVAETIVGTAEEDVLEGMLDKDVVEEGKGDWNERSNAMPLEIS